MMCGGLCQKKVTRRYSFVCVCVYVCMYVMYACMYACVYAQLSNLSASCMMYEAV
jgi:hypothetical protein